MEMKQVKIQDIQGKALDYLVAKCEGFGPDLYMRNIDIKLDVHGKCSQLSVPINRAYVRWAPSTDWAQGGPIVEREGLCVGRRQQADPAYCPLNDPRTICWARTTAGGYLSYGPTLLIAAMRCHVASKMGDVVEVPACLL